VGLATTADRINHLIGRLSILRNKLELKPVESEKRSRLPAPLFSLLLFLNGAPDKGRKKSEKEFRGVISHSKFRFSFRVIWRISRALPPQAAAFLAISPLAVQTETVRLQK